MSSFRTIRATAGGLVTVVVASLTTVLTAASAPTETIADFCPYGSSFHSYNPPITNHDEIVEFGWYAPPKYPAVEESVTFTATVSRPDGSQAHPVVIDAWSRGNPNDGYEIYTRDARPYGPADTGRWKISGEGACADIYFHVLAASRIGYPVPTTYAVAGSRVTVGSTVRGWNSSGVEAPVAGMLVDLDRSPNVAGYPRTGVTRVRTDSAGRVRTPITVYSNTRIYQNDVREASSRHDPAELQAPVIYVYKRISRAVSDTTPAVGQAVKVTGTVYPARGPAYLQRWNGTTFVTIAGISLATGGKYAVYYRPSSRGTHVLRVFTPYDLWHISSASANAYLTVH